MLKKKNCPTGYSKVGDSGKNKKPTWESRWSSLHNCKGSLPHKTSRVVVREKYVRKNPPNPTPTPTPPNPTPNPPSPNPTPNPPNPAGKEGILKPLKCNVIDNKKIVIRDENEIMDMNRVNP